MPLWIRLLPQTPPLPATDAVLVTPRSMSRYSSRLIPFHCSPKNEKFRTNNLCEPVTQEERGYIYDEHVQGGLLHQGGSE